MESNNGWLWKKALCVAGYDFLSDFLYAGQELEKERRNNNHGDTRQRD